MRWGSSSYQPAPQPCPVRGILFQESTFKVGFVDDVETEELIADIRPVTVTPDGIVSHGYLSQEVLMSVEEGTVAEVRKLGSGDCGHANEVVLTDRSLTHLLERHFVPSSQTRETVQVSKH